MTRSTIRRGHGRIGPSLAMAALFLASPALAGPAATGRHPTHEPEAGPDRMVHAEEAGPDRTVHAAGADPDRIAHAAEVDPGRLAPPWGFRAHEMGARAAVSVLPSEVPGFFRGAAEQLAWLNPEPDRWRDPDSREMHEAWTYDHYVDLENLPPGALEAPDRFEYLRILYRAGLDRPEREAGFLYYRILELHQRLVVSWHQWLSAERAPARRAWIEARILNDAGLLGHYVMDASQPHHTTIHFNGWNADTPNPEGYTRDRDMHSRFERFFVDAHVPEDLVWSRTSLGEPLPDPSAVRAAVLGHIDQSHLYVETLYRLDRDAGFAPDRPADPVAVAFTADRLASGSSMLATLWWSAWLLAQAPPG